MLAPEVRRETVVIQVRQSGTWELGRPVPALWEMLRSWLAGLNALFGSWKNEGGEDDDPTYGADPELVAALQFLAAILDEKDKKQV